MRIIKRLDKMFLLAEFPLWNKKTKRYDIYPGDIRVIPDEEHSCYNSMWEWDRIDRRRWYWTVGGYWDKQVLKWYKKKK